MFGNSPLNTLKAKQLRRLMWLFFFVMALPTAVLVYKSYDQLKWEAFYQHRLLAEELAGRIDQRFTEFVAAEEKRSFSDYSFVGQSQTAVRSPLSSFPVSADVPGVVGYFQIDAGGRFSTPLIPSPEVPFTDMSYRFGLAGPEIQQRLATQQQIEQILSSNELVEEQIEEEITPSPEPVSEQAAASSFEDTDFFSRADSPSSAAPQPVAQEARKPVQNQAAFDRLSEIKKAKIKPGKATADKDNVVGRLEELEQQSPYKGKVGKRENAQKKQLALDDKETDAIIEQSVAREEKRSLDYNLARARKTDAQEQKLESTLLDGSRQAGPGQDATGPDSSVEKSSAMQSAPVSIDEVLKNEVPDQDLMTPSRIEIFKGEIDPFEISLLESGHFVLYRKVWRNGERYIQGLLVAQTPFINGLVGENFNSSLLAGMSTLSIIYQGNLLASFSNSAQSYSRRSSQLDGTLLSSTRLSEPFNELQSVFTIHQLPTGSGGTVILWAAFIMALVLSAGIYLLYRMSLRNISLVDQQQDFVSAVSHELKTPLTSIRMYGEILQQGWADEDKKKGYYRYIFEESERLTRLINNVLALARMTRNETRVDLQVTPVSELIDIIQSKLASQMDRSGFKLNLTLEDDAAACKINVDPDVFAQILINLVDNALKFSVSSEQKVIELAVHKQSNNKLCVTVRDFGPGIAKDQLKKIFKLFYRSENELTRETTGTGIGLALVSQLTQLMKGKIDVVNRDPGAEFRLYFPISS